METIKSSDELLLISTLLCDVLKSHSTVFTPRAIKLDQQKLAKRFAREGISLLTKTLPRLGKALDRALTGEVQLDSTGWRKPPGSKLPRFLGGLFQNIFSHDGWILPTPCVKSIKTLRQVLLVFHKYKLPYSSDQEHEVLAAFQRTDDDLAKHSSTCVNSDTCGVKTTGCSASFCHQGSGLGARDYNKLICKAQGLLSELFLEFDERDIYPGHGPGSVSTSEKGPDKYHWTCVSPRITQSYPLDEYFYSSVGAVCDSYSTDLQKIRLEEQSAKVILVPKDSRGPRLISEEPLAFQWIQQGLHRAIVRHVELHPLTRWNVHFTDQQPNQFGALLGSRRYKSNPVPNVPAVFRKVRLGCGSYATLDLKEASDRVSVGLVQLLFPERLVKPLMNCRSLSTKLPNGKIVKLNKFAPMGSALCFPTMALTIWAILAAGASDADARESILVYGDDIIVKAAEAENAIKQLESFGLKVNRDKSCTRGFFRESCGVDACEGVNVTPVKLKTVWESSRRPDVYTSWIEYSNSFFDGQYYLTAGLIASWLRKIYGSIPDYEKDLPSTSLKVMPDEKPVWRTRWNAEYQKSQRLIWAVHTPSFECEIDGWSMLLRYFTESVKTKNADLAKLDDETKQQVLRTKVNSPLSWARPFSVRSYTLRNTSKLVKRWR